MGVFWLNSKQAKRDAKREQAIAEREAKRKEADYLRLSLTLATCKLAYATAIALKRGYPNGEVEEGIAEYEKAMSKFKKFERELVSEQNFNK